MSAGVTTGADQVARVPAYQVFADDLRQQIVSGRLRPGERLPTEPQLCVRSGLSRSTVREGLRVLASQQLIVTTRGVTGGSFVAEPSVERMADSLASAMQVLRTGMTLSGDQFLEIREMLEGPGAAMAAERRTDDDLTTLRGRLLDPASPDEQALAAYWGFHAAMAAAAHNPLFELLVRPLKQIANDLELVQAGPADLWHRCAADTRLVLGYVERGDSPGAAQAVRRHLGYLRGIYRAEEVRLTGLS